MITTTLTRIALADCLPNESWVRLLKKLGKTQADVAHRSRGDEPLPFSRIVEINGLDDAILCFGAEPQYAKEMQLFPVWCAWRVQHFTSDRKLLAALKVAERYANGGVTEPTLERAMDAARAAEQEAQAKSETAETATAWAARAVARAVESAVDRVNGWGRMSCAVLAARAAREALRVASAERAKRAVRTVNPPEQMPAAEFDAAWEAWVAAAADVAEADALAAQTKEFLRIVTETEART